MGRKGIFRHYLSPPSFLLMIMAMMVALQVKMTRMRVTIIKRIKNYRVRAAVTKCGCPRAALRSNCGGGQFEGGVFSFGESEGWRGRGVGVAYLEQLQTVGVITRPGGLQYCRPQLCPLAL